MNHSNGLLPDETVKKEIKYDERGLVPAIAQDLYSGEILMMAYMNEESLQKTLETGNATFWSRSRQKLWMKGETSGNVLQVQRIMMDCDGDTLVMLVNAAGPACHTGERTCFHRVLAKKESGHHCSGCSGCSG